MKENKNGRSLSREEKELMLEALIEPKFLEKGEKISNENLLLVNQLIKKAKAEVKPPEVDPEIQRFLKWIFERFDVKVTKNKGDKVFWLIVGIGYDEADEHVKAYELFQDEKIAEFVVGKKGWWEGYNLLNDALEILKSLKNFELDNHYTVVNNKYIYMISKITMYL